MIIQAMVVFHDLVETIKAQSPKVEFATFDYGTGFAIRLNGHGLKIAWFDRSQEPSVPRGLWSIEDAEALKQAKADILKEVESWNN